MRIIRCKGLSSTSAILLTILLATSVSAQGLPKLPGTQASAAAASSEEGAAATSDGDSKSVATPASKATSKSPATANAKATPTSQDAVSSLPAMTSDAPGLTGLPKLAEDKYPAPSVPPTADAPFMQKSSLPEGTVFICVGAALGFIGMLVLAWRGMVAWSIHRSVKRAAIAQSKKYGNGRDPHATLANAKSAYYSTVAGSTLSLDHLGGGGKSRGSKHLSTQTNLFFSPTAAGGNMHSQNNQGSAYLPAGYYASGNPAPSGMTSIGGGNSPMANLTNQSRHSKGLSKAPSPPRSPSLPPSRGPDSPYTGRLSTQGLINHASSSSLNLSTPAPGRAPSAFLEDLFENHPPK